MQLFRTLLLRYDEILCVNQKKSNRRIQIASKIMNNKLSKIASFIEGLPTDESLQECQSTLLAVNMDSYGAETINGGDCSNDSYPSCKDSTNEGACTNYNSTCENSSNAYRCTSSSTGPTHPSIPKPGGKN